ncbi:hypothetical protein ATO4_11774 [Aurantimonas sp. 22II-16-19i]|nr:hypothetical protein ATO4_11774 [Aurantimonas sp. 22II-16-19i]
MGVAPFQAAGRGSWRSATKHRTAVILGLVPRIDCTVSDEIRAGSPLVEARESPATARDPRDKPEDDDPSGF